MYVHVYQHVQGQRNFGNVDSETESETVNNKMVKGNIFTEQGTNLKTRLCNIIKILHYGNITCFSRKFRVQDADADAILINSTLNKYYAHV